MKFTEGLSQDQDRGDPSSRAATSGHAPSRSRKLEGIHWDLRIGGAETQAYELIKKNGLADVRSMPILP